MSTRRRPKKTQFLTRRFDFWMTEEMYERVCVRLEGGRSMSFARYLRTLIQDDLDRWRDDLHNRPENHRTFFLP